MRVKALLFIDANQFLDLYLIDSGKKLLPALEEQRDYLLVTQQVVDEVHRNKVTVAARFVAEMLKKLEVGGMAVPDHLLSPQDSKIQNLGDQLREIRKRVQTTKNAFSKSAPDLLERISQSRDEVSVGLAGIFSQAVATTDDELQRARMRKERGNPPGMYTDPLSDQLSWEQILSRCQNKPKLWMITNDSDYATKYQGRMFLNAFLYQELARLYKEPPEVFCFDNISDGLNHFASTTRVKAERLPTPELAEQIKKEQESLSPMGSLSDREKLIAELVAEGITNREIAQKLGLAEHTVGHFLFRIYAKLGISSRAELVLWKMNGE